MTKKYELLPTDKTANGEPLFQVKALRSFGSAKKGELGGYIAKESNLSHEGNAWVFDSAEVFGDAMVFGDAEVFGNARVYGNAMVSGDALVYGNAMVSAKKAFTKGWFIGGDDSGKITNITKHTGSTYWKKQYVLGDYKIKDIEEEKPETIEIGGKTYEITDDLKDALRNLKEVSGENGND